MLSFISKIQIGEHTALIILSFIVGLLAGTANVMFRTTMDFFHETVFLKGQEVLHIVDGGVYRLLMPLLPITGALLLIPFSLVFPGSINGYGFSRFLEIVNIRGGVLKVREIFLKTIAPALTIGSGGSAGVEGPIAIIGGTVGSGIGQLFKASGSRMKLLIAAGSAGAIAATFNAPIAGVMFAIEIVLLGNYELSSFAAIVISSGIATFVSRGFYGANPAFTVPQYELRSAFELPLYMFMGLLIGVIAVYYIRIFHNINDRFESLKLHPQLKPVMGAFIVGCFGIFLPEIMGNGYDVIEHALSGQVIFPIIAVLIFMKIIATAITLGSGGAGGVFAPALFIGAMTGGTFGYIVNLAFPGYTASPGAYATVGIGSFLAAATHAPLTGIFLLFEMTGNYKIIIPLMFSAIIGTLFARRLFRDSIDTVQLTRKGIEIHGGMERAIMSRFKVRSIMRGEIITVHEDTLLNNIINIMIARDRFYLPVVNDDGDMTGIVSIQDVRPALFEDQVKSVVTAEQLATENVITLNPSDDLNTAMTKFSLKDIDELPVVEEENSQKVIAMIHRKDIIATYNKEVLKKQAI